MDSGMRRNDEVGRVFGMRLVVCLVFSAESLVLSNGSGS
jgi:hypothetical protein